MNAPIPPATATAFSVSFAPDLHALLAPVPGPERTGPSLRYEPIYAQIREARKAEDDSLPMGDWVRPLKKADWAAAEVLCTQVLATRSKDLQVAAWLTEAWVHQHGIAGFEAGARLLNELARRYWADVHPRIEDGDTELRGAPFVWAAHALSDTLAADVPLLHWPERSPPHLALQDWERALRTEFDAPKPAPARKGQAAPVPERPSHPSRQDILDAGANQLSGLARLDAELQQARACWRELDECLTEKLGDEGPSLMRVTQTLGGLQQATARLLQGHDPQALRRAEASAPNEAPAPSAAAIPSSPVDTPALQEELVASASTSAAAAPVAAASVSAFALPVAEAQIGNREEAYRLLELAATYLQRTEPHSPTPYLVHRAVAWGRLPLPELMQEIVREEGDLSRYFSMLGIKGG